MIGVVVFNLSVLLPTAVAIVTALVVDKQMSPPDHVTAIWAAAAWTAVSAILEVVASARWRPRLFWVFPAWVVGMAVVGGVLVENVDPWLGVGALAIAFVGFGLHVAHSSRGPGGRNVIGIVGAAAGLVIEMVLEDRWLAGEKPWWGYVIRVVLLLVLVVAIGRLLIARSRAARGS